MFETSTKSMAERHSDEISGIIAQCDAAIAVHTALAFYKPHDAKMKRPAGWSRKTASDALRAIHKARAQCSADIREACARQRAEANAKPVLAH